MTTQLECDYDVEVRTNDGSCYQLTHDEYESASSEVNELTEKCDRVIKVAPESPEFTSHKVDDLIEKIVTTGERLLSFHEKWSESIRRGLFRLDPEFENEVKFVFKKMIDAFDLSVKYFKKLGVKKSEVQSKMDFGIVAFKLSKIYYDWETPKLYTLISMRRQIITGPGAKKLKEKMQRTKAQKTA